MSPTVLTETVVDHRLARRIAAVLDLDPDVGAIEYDGTWFTWGQIAHLADRINALCRQYGSGEGSRIGVLLRNRPVHVATLLGVLLSGRCLVVINPSRGNERTRSDITALNLPVVIGEPDDLATLVEPSPVVTTVALPDITGEPAVSPGTETAPVCENLFGTALLMLTSGTTGPPKRVELTYDMLAHSVLGPETSEEKTPDRLSSGVAIVNAPLVHIGGVYRTLQCIAAARPYALLPRFELAGWADAVRRHRPKAVSLVPTALRMVLHSDLTRDDLPGLEVVTSGTAPLSAEDADAFTEKFGVPVLTSYAATEFGGGVAGWTLADHRRFWAAKRGSVGRATAGSRLRVVDEDGTEVAPGTVGLLEVAPAQIGGGREWIRTNDLARIDTDGFLWIHGRADQAIIRGGFKIIPDDVRKVLETYPAVASAVVVGRPEERLGATPVAMVEIRTGATVTESELVDHLVPRLARYEIPTSITVVDAIPRTPSGKPDLGAVKEQLFAAGTTPGGSRA
ncbi:class I adenylate-forming enzyme family protein [Rhodococcus artemisiae]|uniref:Class I adenylate-forming enzyme family protein n=1 Tax=Rhodococcus artemisiae TaxID=714159 RepID=A0ABU7LCA2_9NOCA|nr:class I adenylate-forming enzyme family protein [Rhodococcus artemisiae]MEE2058542.1 class I adenylate-forming enzyme family protein [Rhodococcus artemisiae]